MTVVVTGASGHIGGNLVRALLEQGRGVRALVRSDTRAVDGLDVELVRGDMLDPGSLKAAFAGADTVYHLAAHISVAGDPGGMMERTNVEGVRNVVAACLENRISRLVHFSSIHAVCSQPADEIIDENRPLVDETGLLAYDRTKARGEQAVMDGVTRGLDAVIVNPTAVLGRHDYKPSHMGQVILMLCNRRMLALVRGGFNWVDVRDVVKGAMAAEEKGRRGEKYLLGGHWLTVEALADLVEQFSGVPRPRGVAPLWLAQIGAPFAALVARLTGKRALFTPESLLALDNHRHVSCEKAANDLGYAPRPISETISDTITWFTQTEMLHL